MDLILLAVVGVVALALLFDFTNGFHDAANSTATVVATKALRPRQAVDMAAFFNFAALFVVGTTGGQHSGEDGERRRAGNHP